VRRRTSAFITAANASPCPGAGNPCPGAVLAEQTDERAEQRRYMGVEILAKARQATGPDRPQVVMPTTALSA
jgi:hypothetical protein